MIYFDIKQLYPNEKWFILKLIANKPIISPNKNYMIWVSLDLFSFIMFVTWKNCVFSDSLITPQRPPTSLPTSIKTQVKGGE